MKSKLQILALVMTLVSHSAIAETGGSTGGGGSDNDFLVESYVYPIIDAYFEGKMSIEQFSSLLAEVASYDGATCILSLPNLYPRSTVSIRAVASCSPKIKAPPTP